MATNRLRARLMESSHASPFVPSITTALLYTKPYFCILIFLLHHHRRRRRCGSARADTPGLQQRSTRRSAVLHARTAAAPRHQRHYTAGVRPSAERPCYWRHHRVTLAAYPRADRLQELIRRWDSERELFHYDIAHVLQNTKKRTYLLRLTN